MAEKKFLIGQIIHLRVYMRGNDTGKSFQFGGNIELHRALVNLGTKLGHEINESTIIPCKARVIKYSSYNSEKKCHEIEVEWLSPFTSGDEPISHNWYTMLESEFFEYDSPNQTDSPKQVDFTIGDWVYYMGGTDTEYWKPGKVGQISEVTSTLYRFDSKKGDMTLGGSNLKKFFRRATLDEINRATRTAGGYFTDSHGNIFDKPSQIFGNPCKEITLDLPTAHSITMSMFLNPEDSLKPSEQDETKVSFKSTKLVANKINNSKDIENLLILD